MLKRVLLICLLGAVALSVSEPVRAGNGFEKNYTNWVITADSAASPDSTYDSTYVPLCPNAWNYRSMTILVKVGQITSALAGAGKAARVNLVFYSSINDSLIAFDSTKLTGDFAAARKPYYKAWIGSVGDTLFKKSILMKVSYADTADQSSKAEKIPILWEIIGKQ